MKRLGGGWLIAWTWVLIVCMPAQTGCGTVYNLATPGGSPSQRVRGKKVDAVPQTAVFGGTRQDLYWLQTLGPVGGGYGWGMVVLSELAACIVLDTLLLPVTIPKNSR